MKRRISIAVSVLFVLALTVGTTIAYFTDKESKDNVFTIGKVDIELTEPNYKPNAQGITAHIRPGDIITKDPTVTVRDTSESCYLRAEVTYSGLDEEHITMLEDNISFQPGWIKSTVDQNTWYFQNKVEKSDENQAFVLFDAVNIPKSWGNEIAEQQFQIHISAAAIQADNFTPTRNEKEQIIAWQYEDKSNIEPEPYPVMREE